MDLGWFDSKPGSSARDSDFLGFSLLFAVIVHCNWECVICHSRGIVLLTARNTPCFVRFLKIIGSCLLLSRVPSLAIAMRKPWGKTPAITASQTRQIFARLLRHPAPSPEEITRVLRRNEESRIYHWHASTGTFPPRRSQTDSS
jgi:hypothetical protein